MDMDILEFTVHVLWRPHICSVNREERHWLVHGPSGFCREFADWQRCLIHANVARCMDICCAYPKYEFCSMLSWTPKLQANVHTTRATSAWNSGMDIWKAFVQHALVDTCLASITCIQRRPFLHGILECEQGFARSDDEVCGNCTAYSLCSWGCMVDGSSAKEEFAV